MKIKPVKFFVFLSFLYCTNLLAEEKPDKNGQNALSTANMLMDIPQDPAKLKKFVIQRVKIPLVFADYINMLVFDVEVFFATGVEVNILNDNSLELLDMIICDTFDSARVLLEDKKTLTKSIAEKLRKRIWILLAKKLYTINKYIKIKNVTLTKISYMSRQK